MTKKGNGWREQILSFVEAFVHENGYPPTYDEIRESVGLSSKSHVDYYLDLLEGDGFIERSPRTPRGLRLVGSPPNTFDVAVEGVIAAGLPLQLGDKPGDKIGLTADIADPRRQLFALKVEGDSMVDALVGDGDLVICERCEQVLRGEMAVVYLRHRNEATLKRVFPEGTRVRLQPDHPVMDPIYVDARDVQIQGCVVAIVRRP